MSVRDKSQRLPTNTSLRGDSGWVEPTCDNPTSFQEFLLRYRNDEDRGRQGDHLLPGKELCHAKAGDRRWHLRAGGRHAQWARVGSRELSDRSRAAPIDWPRCAPDRGFVALLV